MIKRSFPVLALALAASTAQANEYAPAMMGYLETNIMSWAQSDVIVSSILEQNTRTGGLGEAEIIGMDNAWRAEVGAGSTPTISPVITNAAAEFLRGQVEASGGAITEVFIMDRVGLNVAASDVTSDMWQGDEAKFSETYGHGPGAVHVGDIEFDESTQTYQGQVSLTIVHPDTGELIGAMTVGLNADALM